MRKLSDQKTQIFFFILSLITATIACNFPDVISVMGEAAMESCFPVDRSRYETEAAKLGQAPETPKYPEHAVYEVCMIENHVSSVRMSEGYRPENNEVNENAEQAGQAESVGTASISVGTYIGEFPWNEDSINELLVNEIRIEISNSGLVSGSATMHQTNSEVHSETCSTDYEFWQSYTVSGQILDNFREPVEVQKTWYEISDSTGCSGEYKKVEDACSCEGLLTISDGELTITCGAGSDCGAYLTAKK